MTFLQTRNRLFMTLAALCSFGWILAGCSKQASTPAPAAAPAPPVAPVAAAAPAGDYPINFCVVTGEPLDAMGEPVVHNHNGREVRFCCNPCIKKFKAEPAKYLAKLDAAVKGQ